jgi:hypothetical protein
LWGEKVLRHRRRLRLNAVPGISGRGTMKKRQKTGAVTSSPAMVVSDSMAQPLPEFENPPVTEVALSVQFDKLERAGIPRFGYYIPFGEGAILFSEVPPPQLHDVLSKISELGGLEEDWDSYGARPVQRERAVTAVRFLLSLVDRDTPMPTIVPTNRGGIQLEWHRTGADLEIQIEAPGRMEVFFEDEQADHPTELTLTSDLEPLVPLLARVSKAD